MNICTKFKGNVLNSCYDISIWTKVVDCMTIRSVRGSGLWAKFWHWNWSSKGQKLLYYWLTLSFVPENHHVHCVDFLATRGSYSSSIELVTEQSTGPPAQLLPSILSISGVKYGMSWIWPSSEWLLMAKQQQGESSLALPVTYTIFTLGFSHSAWAGSRNGSPSLLLAALLGLQDLAPSQPVRQHSTSQALETTRSLQGSSLLFCLTLTGRMNTPLLPPALLSYPTPLGTVPAGLGHCDFSLLSYSRSLSLCVCSYKHTHTHNPSISREHSH